MTVAEAAEPLGEALRSAVAARTDVAGQNLSADLSGGLDSTPLCLLAYQLRSRPLLITQAGDDRANDDARFASLAAASMPGCKHLVQQPHELPLPFSDALTASAGLDEPDSGFRNRSRTAAIGRQLRSFGSTIHIGGAGGDEVLQPPPTYLHGLIRRTPRRGYRYVQAFRARRPACGRGDMLHFLMNQSSYTEWQQQQIADLTSPMPRHLLGSWGTPFRLPPWLTNDAVEIVRDSLTNSQNDEPFDTERGQHDAAESIINAGRVTRMTGQTLAQEFLSSEFPFLDDHVVNIALSVRPEEKADPWTFKPLIRAAMEREVPSEVLSRSTKADVSSEVYDGMRKSREDLLKICTESHLAEAGLLDIDSLVDTLEAPPNPNHHPTMLNETLATEAWLRANA
ncbi:asparagine synthase [Allosaccharopolyspora coralli]|nr:asparagine synthase [Allosaccharopolyspora coralli]